MKKTIANLSFAILIPGLGLSAAAQSHDHHASSHESVSSTPTKEKFKADKNLKSRMNVILKTAKGLHESGTDKAALAKAGEKIESTVNDIFKTCKLEPKADAAIHPVLADLLAGAGQLKKGDLKKGQRIIHQALQKYENIFE